MWLQWLHFSETIGQHLATLTQQHIGLWDDADRSPVVMKIEAKRLARTLVVVEGALAGRDYLLQSGFSAVDIAIGYAVWIARRFADLDEFPAVRQYLAVCSGRPAFQASLPPDGAALIYDKPFYAVWPG